MKIFTIEINQNPILAPKSFKGPISPSAKYTSDKSFEAYAYSEYIPPSI